MAIDKGDEILFFNALHRWWLNPLFVYATRLAEWPMVFFVILVAYLKGWKKALILAINLAVAGLVVNLCKLYFSGEHRPSVFFEGRASLNFIEGVEVLRNYSFPSGHTAVAFAMFYSMSMFFDDKKSAVLLFICALMVGISRIYLMQHFLADVFAGSLLAILLVLLSTFAFSKISWFNQ